MNTRRIIAGYVVLSLLWSVGVAAPPLADKVTADAMLYVGWAGRSLTFDGSMFGQLLAEPGLKEALAAVKQTAQAHLKRDPDALAAFEGLWSMGGIAWRHPAALALYDVSIAGGAGRPPVPRPSGALLIDLQKDRAAFDAQLQKILPVLGKHVKLSDKTIGKLSYKSFPTPVGPCSMGFVGNIFFMAVGEATPGRIAALADGKVKPLSTSPAFTAAMKEVCGEHVQVAYYVDVARLLALVEKLAEKAGGRGGPPVGKIITAMGLKNITAVAGATTIVDRGMYEKCRIFSPAPHRGLLMLMAGKPLGAKALEGVPADADLVAAINLSPADVLAEVKRVAAAIEPRAAKQLEAVLASAGDTVGLNIEKDLLAHMGDQWTLISAPSLGGTLTGTVLVVELKDAKKFSASLAKLQAFAGKMIEAREKKMAKDMEAMWEEIKGDAEGAAAPDGAVAPVVMGPMGPMGVGHWVGRRGRKTVIRTYKSGGVEVHYLAFAGDQPIPVAPAWAVHKGKLYVAAFPQVVIAAAGGTSEKPLAKSAAFAALRKRVSPKASSLAYCNTPSLVRRFYGLVLLGGTAGTNALGSIAPAIRPEMLPPLPKVEKYIWPDISAVSSDAKGITIESYGSLPSGMMFNLSVPQTVPTLAISALLPALSGARGQAKRALSGGNLNGIGKGIAMYHAEHGDRNPPNLATLIEEGSIPAKMLYSPSSGRKPRLDAKGKPIGPIDYVYLGAELGRSPPGNLIMAYERPEINRGKGTNVLYVAGNVKWVSMQQFRRELERTQEFIRKKGEK